MLASVTVTSPPPPSPSPSGSSSSPSVRARLGRVTSSSCGGAWRYSDLVAVRSEGRRICLRGGVGAVGGPSCQRRSPVRAREREKSERGAEKEKSEREGRGAHVPPLEQQVDQVLQTRVPRELDDDLLPPADGALGLLVVLERVRVDRLVARVHPARARACVRACVRGEGGGARSVSEGSFRRRRQQSQAGRGEAREREKGEGRARTCSC